MISSLPLDYKYTYSPPDFSVARFIKYSREHTNKLKNVYDSFASAVVFEEKTKKTVEYQFQPKRVSCSILGLVVQFLLIYYLNCDLLVLLLIQCFYLSLYEKQLHIYFIICLLCLYQRGELNKGFCVYYEVTCNLSYFN